MATINMNAVQFYNPSSTAPSLSARCAATVQKYRQFTGIPHRKEWSRVLESYSQSQNTGKDMAVKQDDYADGSIAADEDDEFLPVDEVIRRALPLEEKPANSALAAAQGTNKICFLDGSGSSMPAQSSLPGHLDGSKEQPFILDDDDDDDYDNSDDDSNSTSSRGISSDLSADSTGRELSPPPSPATPFPGSKPSSSRDPSLHLSAAPHDQSLEGQAIQQYDGCIGRETSEQPSCLALIPSDDEDDETGKGQQQEAGEDREQGARNSDTSSNGDIDDDDNHLQDNDKSEGLKTTKQRRPSPSCDPVIRRSHKRRLQHSDDGISILRPAQQQHQEIYQEKESNHDHRDDQDSDDSEAPRSAKRRRPSPSSNDPTQRQRLQRHHDHDPTSKRTLQHQFQRPRERNTTLVQTQPEQSSSISNSDCRQSNVAPTFTSTGDQEQTSNTRAEYQEWPICGVFKRVIVGDEVRYGMEFSLEEPRACPQHTVFHQSTNDGDSQPGDLWDIQKITAMRKVNGAEEFRVAWAQTWMPEFELRNARELVEEFKAKLSIRQRNNEGQGKTNVTAERQPKRRRGRPRKQP